MHPILLFCTVFFTFPCQMHLTRTHLYFTSWRNLFPTNTYVRFAHAARDILTTRSWVIILYRVYYCTEIRESIRTPSITYNDRPLKVPTSTDSEMRSGSFWMTAQPNFHWQDMYCTNIFLRTHHGFETISLVGEASSQCCTEVVDYYEKFIKVLYNMFMNVMHVILW